MSTQLYNIYLVRQSVGNATKMKDYKKPERFYELYLLYDLWVLPAL